MKKLLFLSSILLTTFIQTSTSESNFRKIIIQRPRLSESNFARTNSVRPEVGKRKRQDLPEDPSAPIKNDFLTKNKPIIQAFIDATPDALTKKHTHTIHYKKSEGATVILAMRRDAKTLSLEDVYSPEETQNLIARAELSEDLENMQVDDSILQI